MQIIPTPVGTPVGTEMQKTPFKVFFAKNLEERTNSPSALERLFLATVLELASGAIFCSSNS